MQMTFYIMDAPTASYYLNVHNYIQNANDFLCWMIQLYSYRMQMGGKKRTLQNEKTTKARHNCTFCIQNNPGWRLVV
jgi:hypothetical protein